MLEATGSISPYATFSVAPRSVSRFVVVFMLFLYFSKGIISILPMLQGCSTHGAVESLYKLKEKYKNYTKLRYRPWCNGEIFVQTYTTSSFKHSNF